MRHADQWTDTAVDASIPFELTRSVVFPTCRPFTEIGAVVDPVETTTAFPAVAIVGSSVETANVRSAAAGADSVSVASDVPPTTTSSVCGERLSPTGHGVGTPLTLGF